MLLSNPNNHNHYHSHNPNNHNNHHPTTTTTSTTSTTTTTTASLELVTFKPELAGRPAEDAEAHLLCTNDWMNIHNIPDSLKVGTFCFTLVGEARLWYESLQPIGNDWPALQNQFRQQYSKIGNTREQLFYA